MRQGGSGAGGSVNIEVVGSVNDEPDDDMVTCPHCKRRFNKISGERHIPICKNTKARPSALKRGSGIGGGMGQKR